MRSAAEAEVGGLYMKALELSPMRTTLEELDHPQLPTPIQIDNSTADGIMNFKQSNKDKVKQRTKDSTGYKIESNKENSEYSGYQEKTILPTTTQNTTRQPHTED